MFWFFVMAIEMKFIDQSLHAVLSNLQKNLSLLYYKDLHRENLEPGIILSIESMCGEKQLGISCTSEYISQRTIWENCSAVDQSDMSIMGAVLLVKNII